MERAVRGEKQIACKLHSKRRCALNFSAGLEVTIRSASDPPKVNAPVAVEVFVLGRNQGVAKDLGEILVRGHHATLQCEGANDAALNVVNLSRRDGTEVLKPFDLRQVCGINQQQSAEGAGQRRKKRQQAKNNPADKLLAHGINRGRRFLDRK